MARDPGSVWAPLPEAGAPDGMSKDMFIVHSTGDNGTAAATRRFFELVGTVTESTFIVGWGPEDPTLQIMDSTDIADANVGANRRGIAVEVVGDGKSGYNAWQRSELIRLGRFAHQTHGVPLRVCPSATSGGYGWHIMFGAPGPWAAVAKICPGPVRIQELKSDIFPAIFSGNTAPLEDDMPDFNDTISWKRPDTGAVVTFTFADWIAYTNWYASQTSIAVGELTKKMDALAAKVGSGTSSGTKLPTEFDLSSMARAVADELDRRARDNDAATGPVS